MITSKPFLAFSEKSPFQASLFKRTRVLKMASVNGVIHRLINLPLFPAAIEEKICHIEGIATVDKLDIKVRQLMQRKRFRKLLSVSSNPPSSLPANTTKIAKASVPWSRLLRINRGTGTHQLQSEILLTTHHQPYILPQTSRYHHG